MARTPAKAKEPAEGPAEEPPAYDPSARYAVRLTRIARFGGIRLLPRNAHELTGAALNALVAAEGAGIVASAEVVDP